MCIVMIMPSDDMGLGYAIWISTTIGGDNNI